MEGKLKLLESVNPPVFGTEPIEIQFYVRPRTGEPFLFTNEEHGYCNTSVVLRIMRDSETGDHILETLNSFYRLIIK